MLNFVICEDQKQVLETMEKGLEKIINLNEIEGRIVLTADNPQDIIKYSRNSKKGMDVYILDINLETKQDGLAVARKIRKEDPLAYIIFITGHIEHTLMTFRMRIKPFDYMVKPINYHEYEGLIKKVEQDYKRTVKFLKKKEKDIIIVKSGYKQYNLDIENIVYVESKAQKLIIRTKKRIIECYGSLAKFFKKLDNKCDYFYRAHKSFIVNVKEVESIDFPNQTMKMTNSEVCLLSRKKKKDFKLVIKETMGNYKSS